VIGYTWWAGLLFRVGSLFFFFHVDFVLIRRKRIVLEKRERERVKNGERNKEKGENKQINLCCFDFFFFPRKLQTSCWEFRKPKLCFKLCEQIRVLGILDLYFELKTKFWNSICGIVKMIV